MSKLLDFYYGEVHDKIRDVLSDCPLVSAAKLGLDERCGTVYVDEDSIIVHKSNNRSIRYYGGFEYIDSDDVTEVGDYVIYSDDNERVRECFDYFRENSEEELAA